MHSKSLFDSLVPESIQGDSMLINLKLVVKADRDPGTGKYRMKKLQDVQK